MKCLCGAGAFARGFDVSLAAFAGKGSRDHISTKLDSPCRMP